MDTIDEPQTLPVSIRTDHTADKGTGHVPEFRVTMRIQVGDLFNRSSQTMTIDMDTAEELYARLGKELSNARAILQVMTSIHMSETER